MTMKNNGRSEGLFELPADAGSDPFEERTLKSRTNFQSRAPRSGADFKAMALARTREAGAELERSRFDIDGLPVDALIRGPNGRRFLFLARGTPDEQKQSGLKRTDTVEKLGFMTMQLARRQELPVVVMTSDIPARKTKAGLYLACLSDDVWDVIGYRGDLRGFRRLQQHLNGPADARVPDAPWRRVLEPAEPQLFPVAGDAPRNATPAAAVNHEQSRHPGAER